MNLIVTSSRQPRIRAKTPRHATKRKKVTKVSILRSYGLLGTEWMRYKNPIEKGIFWSLFSLAIRKRDVTRYGTCISCDRPITMESSDCGHFIPASQCGPVLLFDKRNNNAECSRCNAWDELHLVGYAKGLDKRYGEGTADELLKQHREYKFGPVVKDFTRKEYIAMITKLKETGL